MVSEVDLGFPFDLSSTSGGGGGAGMVTGNMTTPSAGLGPQGVQGRGVRVQHFPTLRSSTAAVPVHTAAKPRRTSSVTVEATHCFPPL